MTTKVAGYRHLHTSRLPPSQSQPKVQINCDLRKQIAIWKKKIENCKLQVFAGALLKYQIVDLNKDLEKLSNEIKDKLDGSRGDRTDQVALIRIKRQMDILKIQLNILYPSKPASSNPPSKPIVIGPPHKKKEDPPVSYTKLNPPKEPEKPKAKPRPAPIKIPPKSDPMVISTPPVNPSSTTFPQTTKPKDPYQERLDEIQKLIPLVFSQPGGVEICQMFAKLKDSKIASELLLDALKIHHGFHKTPLFVKFVPKNEAKFGGLYFYNSGEIWIDKTLTDDNTKLMVFIFELTNVVQTQKFRDLEARATAGQIATADDYAMGKLEIEYGSTLMYDRYVKDCIKREKWPSKFNRYDFVDFKAYWDKQIAGGNVKYYLDQFESTYAKKTPSS